MRGYLLDKSALARWGLAAVADVLDELLDMRLLFTCDVVDMEVLFSARSAQDYQRIRTERRLAYQHADTSVSAQRQARRWQEALAVRGLHRGPGVVDLLLAATAEENDLVVLHYDADYDAIASISPVRTRWVVPRGAAQVLGRGTPTDP